MMIAKHMQLATSHSWSSRSNKNDNKESYRIPTNAKVVIKVVVVLNKNLTIRVNKKIQNKPDCWVSKVLLTYKILSKLLMPFLRKSEFLFFFLHELPLILVVGGKLKIKGPGYLQRTPDIEFKRYRSTGLGAMFNDCHRQTDR